VRQFLALLLAALVFTVPAAAAGRVLLGAPGGGATLNATPAAVAALQRLRQVASSRASVPVIVGLRVPFAAERDLQASARTAQRGEITSAARVLLGRLAAGGNRAKRVQTYSALPFVALDVTAAELGRLAADPLVLSISENIKLRANLAQSTALVHAPQAWAAGFTGTGQTIAIVDTGVDKDHPFLAGKVVSEACYSLGGSCPGGSSSSTAVGSGVPCPYPKSCAHGTHVAGIAAGRGEAASGIAKDANLIAIQVFSPDPDYPGYAFTWYSDVLAALNRVYELRDSFDISSVNLSLGSGRFRTACDNEYPAMTAAIANLRSAGIATVASSGNDGYTNDTEFPACISGAVSVGAVSDENWGPCVMKRRTTTTAADKIACYSNNAAFMSLLAPGSAINSSVPGGGYETWHGTSMAAPHVTGAWAVLKQKFPDASVSDLLRLLQQSGTTVRDYRSPRLVHARIDVANALDYHPPVYALTYSAAGKGTGTVTFSPSGGAATCSGSCTQSYEGGSVVTLTATAATGSRFTGWSGAGRKKTACVITMSQAQSVTAAFSSSR